MKSKKFAERRQSTPSFAWLGCSEPLIHENGSAPPHPLAYPCAPLKFGHKDFKTVPLVDSRAPLLKCPYLIMRAHLHLEKSLHAGGVPFRNLPKVPKF